MTAPIPSPAAPHGEGQPVGAPRSAAGDRPTALVVYLPAAPARVVLPWPQAITDEAARLARLRAGYAAEFNHGAEDLRAERDLRLMMLTSRPEPQRDVYAALVRLTPLLGRHVMTPERQARARALAETHTRDAAAVALGISVTPLRKWAIREGVVFVPGRIGRPPRVQP